MTPCNACGEVQPGEGKFCSTCGEESLQDGLPKGSTLVNGTYEILSILGQGGFGITYLAHDHNLDRRVAIKEFFPMGSRRTATRVGPGGTWSEQNFGEARQRFLLEGRTLARFNHPGIVRVHSAFEENQTAYIVMEFLSGRTLESLLLEHGALPEREAISLTRSVGLALEEVHRLDLLHRDVKPSNILLTEDGRIVLVDFGTARQYAAGMTSKQSVMLTPGYAPLEQYAERGRRGPYTDVYSLAATMFHLLTGSYPESAPDRATGEPLADLRTLRPDLSPQAVAAVIQGMEMDSSRRPQSVSAFLALLEGPGQPTPAPERPTVKTLPLSATALKTVEELTSSDPPRKAPGSEQTRHKAQTASIPQDETRLPFRHKVIAILLVIVALLFGAKMFMPNRPSPGPAQAPSSSAKSQVLLYCEYSENHEKIGQRLKAAGLPFEVRQNVPWKHYVRESFLVTMTIQSEGTRKALLQGMQVLGPVHIVGDDIRLGGEYSTMSDALKAQQEAEKKGFDFSIKDNLVAKTTHVVLFQIGPLETDQNTKKALEVIKQLHLKDDQIEMKSLD